MAPVLMVGGLPEISNYNKVVLYKQVKIKLRYLIREGVNQAGVHPIFVMDHENGLVKLNYVENDFNF